MSEMVKDVITVPGQSAGTLAAEIVAIRSQANNMVMMSAVEIGRRLVAAKALVGHGEWGRYIKAECQLSQRAAENCMKLFREWSENPNSQALANMTPTNAIRLLAMPEEDREELLNEHDVSEMSSRDLDRLIKERDAAKAVAEAEKAERERAQAERDAAQADCLKASTAAEKARNQLQYAKEHPEIPEKMKKELVTKAAAKAERETEARMQQQVDAANKKAADAESARQTAEREAQAAKEELKAAAKSAQLADPDIAKLSVLFDHIRDDFNRVNGYLKKISGRDPEQGKKLRSAFKKLITAMDEAVGDVEKTKAD